MSDWEHLTERQQIALDFLALVERKRRHQVRRDALAAYANRALADANIATAVRNCLRYRREHGIGGRPVVALRVVGGKGDK